MKTNPGRFFEDYRLGEVIRHAVPRTVGAGERALYHALYPARGALYSSDEFARSVGLAASPLDDLIAFHTVFGKTVPDISLNAVANLGYAEGRWLKPVWPGDTLRSESEVIGLKETSSGATGVVWVRTRGLNQNGEVVLDYVRWVMVRKRRREVVVPAHVPVLAPVSRVLPVLTRFPVLASFPPVLFPVVPFSLVLPVDPVLTPFPLVAVALVATRVAL